MSTPVGWIIGAVAAIAGAVYVIYQNWDAIASWFTARIDSVKQAFSDGFLTGITSILMEFNPVVLVADAINGLIAYLFGVDMLGLGKEFIRGLWDGIKEGFAGLTSWLAEALRGLTAWMPDWVKDKLSIAMPEGGPLLPINTPPVGGAVRKATVVAGIMASAVAPSIIPAVAKASDTSRVTPLSVAAAANPGAALTAQTMVPPPRTPPASLSNSIAGLLPRSWGVAINAAEVDAVRPRGACRSANGGLGSRSGKRLQAALTD